MTGPIWVVDDDRDVREALRMILEAYGLTVQVPNDPFEALDWLARGPPPAVIVLDMRMPEMSGEEFLGALGGRGMRGRVPVVVLSGDTTARNAARLAGASDFLAKPVDVQELLATLGRYAGDSALGTH